MSDFTYNSSMCILFVLLCAVKIPLCMCQKRKKNKINQLIKTKKLDHLDIKTGR